MERLEDIVRAYRLRQEQLETQGVYFIGTITDEEAERFSQSLLLMAVQRQYDTSHPITLYINSGGGSVGAGLAMIEMAYKVRRDYGVAINTVITGYAYSMGAIVAQCGDKRSMGSLATMMLHSSQWILSGEDEKIFRDYAKLARHYKQIVGELFARRTGKHTAEWWQRYIYSGRDKFLTAQECLELGLVDEVFPLLKSTPR